MKAVLRRVLSIVAGFVTFLASAVSHCDDGGGSDWERCRSFLGNPIFELPGVWSLLVPVVLGVAIGGVVWWMLGYAGLRD